MAETHFGERKLDAIPRMAGRAKPSFRDVATNNFEWLGIPLGAGVKKQVRRRYERLDSHMRAPIREGSFTILNRRNAGQIGEGVLRHLPVLARDVVRIALEQLVHLHPQCLFPIDIT